jgi:AcrR family transcriptional regulator
MNRNGGSAPDRRTALRLEILRSAAGEFRRRGFERAGMRDIAGAMGLTTGALYYRFRSKGELLYFCQDYSLDRMLEAGARVRRERSAPDEQLKGLIRAQMMCMLDELQGTAAHAEFETLPPRLLRKVVAKRDRYERLMRGIVERGMKRGVFERRDAKLVTLAILGAINWTIKWYQPDGPKGAEEIAAEFADYLVAGLTHA